MEGFFGRIFWIFGFSDFSGFFRILISCSNFDLKKINFLILYFFQFLFFIFIFLYFLFLFFDYSAKFRAKKIALIFEIPKVNESETPFSIYYSKQVTAVSNNIFRVPESQSFDSWIKRMIAQPSEGNKTGEGTAVMSHECVTN